MNQFTAFLVLAVLTGCSGETSDLPEAQVDPNASLSFAEMRDGLREGQIIGIDYEASMDGVDPSIIDFEQEVNGVVHTRMTKRADPGSLSPIDLIRVNQYSHNGKIEIMCVIESFGSQMEARSSFAANVVRLENVAGPATGGTALDRDPMDGLDNMMARDWSTTDGYRVVLLRDETSFMRLIANQAVAQSLGSDYDVCI